MSNPIGERNLLFGILALQKNFISCETFAEAVRRWTVAKKKDLAQILREQKALTENQHALLEESIDNHVARHGKDMRKSLAAVWLVGPARQAVQAIADPDVQAALAHVSTEPIEEAEAIIEEEADIELAEAVTVIPAPAPIARPKRPPEVRPSGIPGWVFIAVAAAVGLLIAVTAGGVAVMATFFMVMPVAQNNLHVVPVVEAQVEERPIQPLDPPVMKAPEEPAIKRPVEEPPVVKPAFKRPVEQPPVVKPAVQVPPLIKAPVKGSAVVAKNDFVPLFNGKDLTGWRLHKQSADIWRVENGILIGGARGNKIGRLNTENPQPKDFHLRVEARIGDKANGNVGFRCPEDARIGYNAPFVALNGKPIVGSLNLQTPTHVQGLNLLNRPAIVPGQWFTLEILAQGSRFILKVNGITTTDTVDGTYANAGHISLNQIGGAPIEFRRIEIKELPPGAAPELVAKVPVVSGFLLELPLPAGRACLSADGLRVAYTIPKPGAFAFREAPAFDVEKVADVKEILTPLHPLASSPDGQRMAFTAGTKDGPKVLLYHWGTNNFDKYFSLTNLAISSAFSPDGKYLATYLIQTPTGQPVEYWLHLHETDTGKSVKQWQLDSAPTFYGFKPDSRTLFFATKRDDLARTWNIANAQPGTMAFPDVSKKHFFSRDFSRFTYTPMPHVLQVTYTISQRVVGKMDMKNPATQIAASAFSPDNRYLLIGADDPDNRPLGRAMLFEFATGKEIGNIQKLTGVPDRIDFAANGIGLLQGQNLRPRLYRLPTSDALVKAPAPDGFVPLFNGKDLTGWKSGGPLPGDWQVVNGVLTGAGRGLKMLYTPRDDYGDFHLRAETRINDDGYSSLMVRYPYRPAEIEKWRRGGYAFLLDGRADNPGKIGSLVIYDKVGVRQMMPQATMVRTGEWFTLEVIAQGSKVTTKVNGKVAVNFLNTKTPLLGGRIVLEANATNRQTVVEYRKIEIKEFKAVPAPPLPPPEGPLGQFVSVLPGKDLAGWRVEGNQGWKISDTGDLVGQGPGTALISRRSDYRCFIVKVELSASADAEAFFAFRQVPDPDGKVKVKGLTSRITGDGVGLRAGFQGIDAAKLESGHKPLQFQPNEWVTLEFQIKRDGGKFLSNGQWTATLAYGPDVYPPGAIGIHVTKGTVRIRKFEVSEEQLVAVKENAPPDRPVAKMVKGEFVPLFNGKDLTGWAVQGKDGWKVADGGDIVGQGPDTALVTTRKDYKNFNARIELSASADTEAFLAFRENPGPNAAVKLKGVTTRLIGDGENVSAGNAGLNGTKFESGQKRVRIKAGESITLEVQVRDDTIKISTNGQETASMPIPAAYLPGAIGLHVAKGMVRVKKFEVAEERVVVAKEIAPVEPAPVGKAEFVPLFNGKDLTGWQPHAKRAGNWRVENGILIGSAPIGGALYTTRDDFQDFHLRADARINAKGFGRLHIRAAYDPTKIPFKTIGYETLINQRPVGAKTGTLTATGILGSATTPAKDAAAPPGEWFLLEVIAKGDQVTVKVNGTTVAEYLDVQRKFAQKGHIVLQQDANAVIEFRKVEIMDPSAVKLVAPPAVPIEPPAKKGDQGGFKVRFSPGDAGKWRIDGKELVQETPKAGVSIFFGDPKWTDYDFSVWAMRTKGNDQFALWFRCADEKDMYVFGLGGRRTSELHMAARVKNGLTLQQSVLDAKDSAIETDRWHHAKISVRGEQALCYLDGVKIFEFTADKLRAGAVGLRTWDSAYRFKNIKIAAPDGKVLLEGLPDFPAGGIQP